MARKLKGRKSSKSGRDKRKQQSSALERRIKRGQQRTQLYPSIIKQPDRYTLWRPGDGQHIIDILPYNAGKYDITVDKKGDETYTFEAWIHRNVGTAESMVICPLETFKKPCPICEHRQYLRENDAEKDVWKKLFPKRRNLYNIICYDSGQEEKGVQIWEVPYFYSEQNILAIAEEAERGGGVTTIRFPSARNGKSISFKIVPAQSKNDYASYEGFKFLDRDYRIKKSLLKQCAILDTIVKRYDYDELSQMFYSGKTKEEKMEDDIGKEPSAKHREREPLDDKADVDVEDMMDELDECEDLDDLEEFAENYGFDITIKKKSKFKTIKRKLERMVMELKKDEDEDEDEDEDLDDDYDDDTDDDEDSDDDDDEDEDDDDDEDDDESEYAYGDLLEMKRKELRKVIKDEDLDVDMDDYDNLEELVEAIASELDIPF